MEKNESDDLDCYVKKINRNTYNKCIIIYHFLVITVILKDKVIRELPMKEYFKHNT